MRKQFAYLELPDVRQYVGYSALIFGFTVLGAITISLFQSQVSTFALLGATSASDPTAAALYSPFSTAGYFLHNVGILLGSWIFGFSGIGTLYVLFENGFSIGSYLGNAIVAAASGSGSGWFDLFFIIPHGIIEIPAILLGSAQGLYIAEVVYKQFRKEETIDIGRSIIPTVPWIALAVLMLAVAAFIEANFSVPFAKWVVTLLGY